MGEFAIQIQTLRDQRVAALGDLAALRPGEPCYFDGEDVTAVLIARAEENIRVLDELIGQYEWKSAHLAEWIYAERGWVAQSC
jgi:hypothetical protein